MKRPSAFYRRVPVHALVDHRLRALGWPEGALYSYLIAGPHSECLATIYRLPMGYIVADLGKPEGEITAALASLTDAGLIEYDREAELVLVVGLQGDLLDGGPRQVKALQRHLAGLPPGRLVERWRRDHGDLIAEDTPSADGEYPTDTPSKGIRPPLNSAPLNSTRQPAKPASGKRTGNGGTRGMLDGDPF